MRRRLSAFTLAGFFGAWLVLQGAEPAQACESVGLSSDAQASSCGELGWSYHPATRSFGYGSQVTASDDPDGARYVYQLVADCDRNVSAGGTLGSCANFGNCPSRVGPDGDTLRVARYQGLRARKGPDGRRQGPLAPYGAAICVYQGKTVPMAAVVAAVRQELTKQVGRPTATVQPATRGLIHWPILLFAPPQHTTTLTITRPLRGAITARPDYTWDLGDSQAGQLQPGDPQPPPHGAGHPYTDRLDPRRADTDGYYVKATYDTPGTHPITLTLTWTATIHLGPTNTSTSTGTGLDVDLDPITFTDHATATVVSATNRLYS